MCLPEMAPVFVADGAGVFTANIRLTVAANFRFDGEYRRISIELMFFGFRRYLPVSDAFRNGAGIPRWYHMTGVFIGGYRP